MFLPNCARISFPFPAPYRSAKPVSATCGLQEQDRSGLRAGHRRPALCRSCLYRRRMEIPSANRAERRAHHAAKAEKVRCSCFRRCRVHPHQCPAAADRGLFRKLAARPKRTSSLLRTSVPAPVCSSTSSPPSLSPPSSCGSTIDSHYEGEAVAERRLMRWTASDIREQPTSPSRLRCASSPAFIPLSAA